MRNSCLHSIAFYQSHISIKTFLSNRSEFLKTNNVLITNLPTNVNLYQLIKVSFTLYHGWIRYPREIKMWGFQVKRVENHCIWLYTTYIEKCFQEKQHILVHTTTWNIWEDDQFYQSFVSKENQAKLAFFKQFSMRKTTRERSCTTNPNWCNNGIYHSRGSRM